MGEPVPLETESYTEPDTRPVSDLLVVIDNGPELEPLLPSVRENLSRLMKYATVSGYDVRFGLTTVAGGATAAPAELVPAPNGDLFVDSRAPDAEANFESLLSALSTAPSSHASLDTAIAALDLAEPGGINEAFARPEAWDSFLFVSAHREQSARTPVQALNRLLEQTRRARQRAYLSVNVIAPIAGYSPCVDEPDDGSFQWLVKWTNGVADTICTPDWSKSLESLEKVSFGIRTEIPLQQAPDLSRGELRLTLDGSEVPQVDQRGARIWKYDGARNSIVLEPLYALPPGQTAELEYPLRCP